MTAMPAHANMCCDCGQGKGAVPKDVERVIIHSSVTEIGDKAFDGCMSLTSVVMPNGVITIGGFAFDGCTSLTSVVIPNGVTSIGNGAFQRCRSLAYIEIPEGITIGWFAFWGGPAGRKIKTIQEKVEPEPCTSSRSIDTPKSIEVKEEPKPSQFFAKLFFVRENRMLIVLVLFVAILVSGFLC